MDVIYMTLSAETTGSIKNNDTVAKLKMHIVIGATASPPPKKGKGYN